MNGARNGLAGGRLDRFAVRIGGPGASLRGQWPVLVVSMAAVFACFYAIGRVVDTDSSSTPVAAPSTLQAASVDAAIPHALSGGSPTAGAVPGAIAPAPPSPRPRARSLGSAAGLRAAAITPSLPTTATRTSAPISAPQSASAAPQTVSKEASLPSRSSGPASSGHGTATRKSSSGGVLFDSSE
jgi:hypothetical protein